MIRLDKKDPYIVEIQEYYKQEYYKQLHIETVKNKQIQSYLSSGDYLRYSQRTRLVGAAQLLKYTYLLPKTELLTIVFKATMGAASIYAYLYGVPRDVGDTPIDIKYVCLGGTFNSQDGEYRTGMITWRQYLVLLDHHKSLISKLESKISTSIERGDLNLSVEFYGAEKIKLSEIEEYINNSRHSIYLLILCWLRDRVHIKRGTIQNHIIPSYKTIISDILSDELLGDDDADYISNHISYFAVTATDKQMFLQVGQKIQPLSMLEVAKPGDIHHDIWREIYITSRASNLVLNLISPSFSIYNNWFYIQSAHAGLFDNLAMHEKYEYSKTATKINSSLQEIDKLNFDHDEPISPKFAKVTKYIYSTINYIDSDIRLSDICVCSTGEYVGRTLRDIPILYKNKSTHHIDYDVFADNVFPKYVFEYIYALLCMNTKLGVIHSDLHINNITINRFYNSSEYMSNPAMPANPKIAYIIDQDVFIFPSTGSYSTIIDFSRAILGSHIEIARQFGKHYASSYMRAQENRIYSLLLQHYLQIKNNDNIKSIIADNFPVIFKVLTIIDTIAICNSIKHVADIIGTRPALIDDILENCNELFIDYMSQIMSGELKSADDIEWPNLTIIRKHFSPISSPPDNKNGEVVCDLFNYNNEVEYDISHYDSWGPLLKIDKELELRKKYNKEIYADILDWINYKSTDEHLGLDAVTAKYRDQEKYLLDIKDWMYI